MPDWITVESCERKERESVLGISVGFIGREMGEGEGLTIACGSELIVGGVGTFGVGGFGTNGTGDRGLEEVGGVGLWWVGVVAWFADVVDVEVVGCGAALCGGLAEGAFNVVVAGIVG